MKEFEQKIGEVQFDKLKQRLKNVNYDITTHGIRNFSSSGINYSHVNARLLTGYAYDEYYDWDLYFENLYLSYFGESRFCRNNLEVFLDRQLECGFVSRTIVCPRERQHFKPFIAQTAWLSIQQTNDNRWLIGRYYTRIKKYLEYWFYYCDLDKNGLCVWDSADHSGMDNQDLRAGKIGAMEVEGVDLNCYLYRELLAMEKIAISLGEEQDAVKYAKHAQELASKINEIFWCEKDEFYYDRNEKTGELVCYRSIAGFMPLWAGIVSQERAKIIIEKHLLNPNSFWLEYPVAAWAKDEEGYYQQRRAHECNWMGTCWIPLNYLILHALMDYGYKKEAESLAYRTFEMVLKEADTREYYNAETGSGQGLNPFWGWSALAYFMPLNFEMNYNPMNLDGNIRPLGIQEFDVPLYE
ncbi:MAG: trehalase family glycosidase [Eubacteriales bacterium]